MRMWVCLSAIAVLGILVLLQLASPSLDKAWWCSWATTLTGILMCWGGVEASRWILRDSPIAKTVAPKSDWGRLWMWCGVPSGVFMIMWLILGWMGHTLLPRPILSMVIGQALLGPCLWLIATPWMLPEVYTRGKSADVTTTLVFFSFILHGLGALLAFFVFPHFSSMSVRGIFGLISQIAGMYPLAFFHLLLVGCSCWITNKLNWLPIKK